MAGQNPGVLGTAFDDARKQQYLDELEKTGEPAEARRLAGGVSSPTVCKHRKADAEFAENEREAMARYCGGLGKEIHRRGFDGVDEPVFYKGEEIARVTRYSDQLAALHARRHIPEYRDKVTVDQNITTKESPLSALAGDFSSLAPESRDLLRRVLEIEAARQEETDDGQADT